MKRGSTRKRPAGSMTSKEGDTPIGAQAGPGRCHARIVTDSPCGRPAATEILGVPFCERCARVQERYFAIGELAETPRGRAANPTGLGRDAEMRRPRVPHGLRPGFRGAVARGAKVSSLLIALLLTSVLASAACGVTEQARGGSAAADPKAAQEAGAKERPSAGSPRGAQAPEEADGADRSLARAGAAEANARGGAGVKAGDARAGARAGVRAGDAETVGDSRGGIRENAGKKVGPKEVTLKITGDPQARFSGACSVGGTERTLGGRAPERYVFEPDGKRLECRLRKEGGGALSIVFEDGAGTRSEQRIGAGESTVTFAYSNGGTSSSTLSVSGDRAATFSEGFPFDGSP